MKAAIYYQYKGPIQIEKVADPQPGAAGVVIAVEATGICRSDWWGWCGFDADILLPHVPGHELAGRVVEVGAHTKKWSIDDRVTVPFVGGCGTCPQCRQGHQQVCDNQFQPGFTAWGSFAEYVRIDFADENLVRLPESLSYIHAASLGCRFITSYRALIYQAKLRQGETVAIHGCGGVGLSAILIAKAKGAKVIAVDISQKKLDFAKSLGADICLLGNREHDISEEIKQMTDGGADVSMDALGSEITCIQSIKSLSKRGRHVQVGLMEGSASNVSLPMNLITGRELEIYGSHGMQAAKYSEIFSLIDQGLLDPGKLVTHVVDLSEGKDILMGMEANPPLGIAVIGKI